MGTQGLSGGMGAGDGVRQGTDLLAQGRRGAGARAAPEGLAPAPLGAASTPSPAAAAA